MLYTGVTNGLNVVHMNINVDHVLVLRENIIVTKLVYYEIFQDLYDAIAREQQIKAGSRKKKLELVNSMNP